ncbi:unnamed protein product [Cuscuta europaea]|uniref:Uncharacterized protein n=1 Tax=Cuscuta europaea TaxID=41803 RepID=A0A9P0ZEI9_CUSEU|nr:unnamed protein product [Cuscuta europaea]
MADPMGSRVKSHLRKLNFTRSTLNSINFDWGGSLKVWNCLCCFSARSCPTFSSPLLCFGAKVWGFSSKPLTRVSYTKTNFNTKLFFHGLFLCTYFVNDFCQPNTGDSFHNVFQLISLSVTSV